VRPNFFRLQALLVVAETGSIAGAARKLSVTAPAVTKAVRQLERDYDAEFFIRARSGVTPTPAGAAMIRRARLVFNELDHAQDEVREIRGIGHGKTSVGALAFARSVLLPRALVRFARAHPDHDIHVFDGEFDNLIDSLREGKLDFIVGALRETQLPDDVVQDHLFDDPVVVVVRRDHALSGRKNVPLTELVRHDWIVPPLGSPVRRLFEQSFTDAGVMPPLHPVTTTSLEVMRGMLLESDRIGIVSRNRVYYELAHGLLAELRTKLSRNKRGIGIIHRRDAVYTSATQDLLKDIRIAARELQKRVPGGAKRP